MLLGDSITKGEIGSTQVGGFRDDLETLLTNNNINFDFVGSLQDGVGFDPDHEGHDAWDTDQVDNNINTFLTQWNPDMVLIHIGTNDISSNVPNTTMISKITGIVDKIQAYNPLTKILLSALTPRNDDDGGIKDSTTSDLNTSIEDLISERKSQGYQIFLANHNVAFKANSNWADDYLFDEIHPTDGGYSVMADVYIQAIQVALNQSPTTIIDDFNRSFLGSAWTTVPTYEIINNELANNSTSNTWDLAVFTTFGNPSDVAFMWGVNATSVGTANGGIALMLDSPSVNANGYLVFREPVGISLWTIVEGSPSQPIDGQPGLRPFPQAGSIYKVVMRSDALGHHFDTFINDSLDGTVTDSLKLQGTSTPFYAGVMIRNNGLDNNSIDDFTINVKQDTIAPATVADLVNANVSGSNVLLTWTAPGDDDTTGQATSYDLRFSTSLITASNFENATQVANLPTPGVAGSAESFAIVGLLPNTTYYCAIKTIDDASNISDISNVVSATTINNAIVVDDFNRAQLGPNWSADPEYQLVNGELANTSQVYSWDFLAVYTGQTNPMEVSFRWGANANAAGIAESGLALMLDSGSPDANGYLIFRETDGISLWAVVDGVPSIAIVEGVAGAGPVPQAGSEFRVVMRTDDNGHHFDTFIDDQFNVTVTDPLKGQGNTSPLYAGVMLRGNLINNVDDFTVTAPPGGTANLSLVTGDNQTGLVGQILPDSLVVRITDSNNFPVPGVSVSYDVTSGGGELLTSGTLVQVNAGGGSYVDSEGKIWEADQAYTSGSWGYVGTASFSNSTSDPIANTANDPLYQIERAKVESYRFDVPSGDYIVKLHFAEIFHTASNKRVFDVFIEGALVLSNFDIFAEAGHDAALIKTFNANVNDDHLDIDFVVNKDNATIMAIEVMDATAAEVSNSAGEVVAFWLLGPSAGTQTAQASAPGLAGSPINFTAIANPDSVETITKLSGDAQTASPGTQLPNPFVVELKDQHGNLVGPNYPVNFDVITGNGTLSTPNPVLTDALSRASNTFTTATDTSINEIKVTAPGYTGPDVIFTATAEAGPPENFKKYAADSGDNQTGTAGRPLGKPFKVQITDMIGTPVPGIQVTFQVTGAGGNFGGSSSTIATTDSAGIAEAMLTLGPAPNVTNTAQATASFTTTTINFTATSAPPKDLILVSQSTFSGTANMPLPDSLKVKVTDTLDNPLSNFLVSFSITEGGGKINGSANPQEIFTDEDGIARAQWTLGPISGTNNNKVEASAIFDSQPLNGSPIEFTASAAEAPASDLEYVSGDSQSSVIQNPLPLPFVVKVTDGNNPIASWPVTFTVVAGGGNIDGMQSKEVVTNGSGEASVTPNLGSTAGELNNVVEATSRNNGDPLNGSPVTFRATARASNASTLTLISSSNLSGQAGEPLSERIQVRVTDDDSNNIKDHPVRFAVTMGGGMVDGTTDTVVVTDDNGIASVVWYLGAAIGDSSHKLVISANDGVEDLKNSPIELYADAEAGPLDPDVSTVTADISQVQADGQTVAKITVTLTDKFENPIAGKGINIISSGEFNFISNPDAPTDANGQAVGTIASTKAEVKTITARVIPEFVELNTSVNVRFTALEPVKIDEGSGNNQTGNIGTALQEPIVAIVRDKHDNPVPGVNVNFVITNGGGSILNSQEAPQGSLSKSTLGIVTNSDGEALVMWILGQKPGTNTMDARVSGLTGSPVPFTATGVDATPTDMNPMQSSNLDSIIVGGALPEPLKVKVIDASGKPVWNVSVTFNVVEGNGSVSDPSAVTNYQGIAQTNFTVDKKVGTNVVEVSSPSLSPVSFTFEGTVGTPAILSYFKGPGGSGVANSLYQISVLITDVFENPIEGVHAKFEVIEGDASIESEQNTTTVTNGTASAFVRLPTSIGTVKVKATSNDLPDFFKIFEIFVVSGSAVNIAELSGNNQEVTIGRDLVYPLEVLVTDTYGNPVAGQQVTWVTQNGNSVNPGVTESNDKGIASTVFTIVNQSINQAAAIAFGLNGSPVDFAGTGVTNNFPLFVGLNDTSVVEGNLLQFEVIAEDADQDPLTYEAENLPPDATFNPSNRTFSWTPGEQQKGVYEVTFKVSDNQGGLDAVRITITVKNSNNPPEISAWNPQEFELVFTKGQNILFSVTAKDADDDGLTYHWKKNDILVSNNFEYEFISSSFDPGTYIITVDVSDNQDVVSLSWEIDIVVSVELSSFQAQFDRFKGVEISWSTSREIDNLGYNILRSLTRGGDFTKLNNELILSNENGEYQFPDLHVEVGKSYFYILEDVDIRGVKTQHGPISIDINAPRNYELSQNYPNPFNPETKIRFQIPEPGLVVIKIYNLLGSEVKTLVEEDKNAGFHVLTWDATDNYGSKVSSGIYYYRITAGKFNSTKKMILMK